MTLVYTLAAKPSLEEIHVEVEGSTMTNKNLGGLRWDDETKKLRAFWEEELSSEDNIKFDGIVLNSVP